MEPELLKTIYYCLVYSHLSYGIHAWGSACESDLNKILVLQKKAARIMTGNQYFQIYGEPATPLPTSEPLFKSLKILKLNDIFLINIAKFVYATLSNESPLSSLIGLYTPTQSIHTLLHQQQLSTESSILILVRLKTPKHFLLKDQNL